MLPVDSEIDSLLVPLASEQLQENKETMLVLVSEQGENVITFETAAPYSVETEDSTSDKYQKTVTIAHDSALHYTNILSQSDIPESLVLQGVEFSLFWMVDGIKTDVTSNPAYNVQLVDTDANGVADKMQWTIPQLSEQTFVIEGIILATHAQHLDSARTVISDVYDLIKERDGVFTGEIPAGDYIRVTFEQALTSANDITIFAKSSYLNSTVEVYEKDSDVLIATFDEITYDAKYRILLTSLDGTNDTFDLKIIGGAIEFDHIIDPFASISATLNSASSVTVASGATISAAVTATTSGGGTSNDWRSTSWRISTTAPGTVTCVNTADELLSGTYTKTFDITAPVTGGTYNAYFILYNSDDCTTGSSATLTMTGAVIVDTTAPTVSSVSSTTANGSYTTGSVIAVTVQFNEVVNVAGGTPRILLETGITDRYATYSSGTGSNTLTFNYTVVDGDVSADLDYTATTSLELNGATIRDAALNNAVLTLATPGAANSLGANKAIVIDTTAPTFIAARTALNTIVLTFSEPVTGSAIANSFTVAGASTVTNTAPSASTTITLTTIGLTSTSGTPAVNYVAATGDIADAASNEVANGGAIPAADQVPPVITAAITGSSIILTYSENVDVTTTDGSGFTLSSGFVTANTDPGDVSNQITLSTTGVGSGDAPNVIYASISGTVKDTQGNAAADQTFSDTIDGAAPTLSTVSIASDNADTTLAKVGDTVTVSFTSDEEIDNVSGTIGGELASVSNISGNDWELTRILDGSETEGTLDFTIDFDDLAGNAGTQVTATTDASSVTTDFTNPTLSSVSSTIPNGTYINGDFLIEVTFDEIVTVAGGTPFLELNSGATAFATYVGGSGSTTLNFKYLIGAGDTSSDLDYDAINSLNLGGATIRDGALNDADLTLPVPGAAGSLGFNKNLVIDTTTPINTATATGSVSISTNNGVLSSVTPIMPPVSPPQPSGVTFIDGMLGLKVEGLTPGASVTLTITLPNPVPVGSAWWKYDADGTPDFWYSVPIGSDDGDNTIEVTLTDGGLGDTDGIADGTITDPGGPAAFGLVTDLSSVANNNFDTNKDRPGQQFKLLFTPGSPYTLTSSNKGQFMYNLEITGAPGSTFDIDVKIPYPFTTVGPNPVKISKGTLDPITVPNANGVLTLADYGGSPVVGTTQKIIKLKGTILDGEATVRIHLKYGLVGTTAYTILGNLSADTTGTDKDIPNYAKYNFYAVDVSGKTTDDLGPVIIESENVVNKVTGFGGLVKDIDDDPVSGAKVRITGSGLPAAGVEVTTDSNGYYFNSNKYTGKAAEFKIKLLSSVVLLYGEQEKIQNVKSNSYIVTNFDIPADVAP